MSFLGIEIGGTKLQMVAGNEPGTILQKICLPIDKTQGAAGIQQQIEVTLPELVSSAKPSAIGVGFGGPVDWQAGKICVSHQISGWSGFDMRSWLENMSQVPVVVENDANVAALGEAVYGAGIEFPIVFYVTIGSGIGGGLIVNKQIYHGALPGEAEIGHIRLDRKGTTIESACSGWAVDRKIRQAVQQHPNSLLHTLTAQVSSGEARFLASALAQQDALAIQILQEVATDLAFGLSHVVHLFHSNVIVLGGGLSLLGESLQQAVSAALPGFLMEAFLPGPQIRLAGLGEDAVPIGALELAKRYFLNSSA
ncbi:ROK family protein [Rhodocytophaga rosea]|uniref:ROK family protein n=1 Tax=Rhodocytophaga rosea TaxID=2704465 RepID=A0A6C0GN14_9BACT|nr:ROK family protein [Rhodocytophaga rosea]QHT69415.1 ROK family protein [Rhodocytophaga rosea]